jgi:hypothetical protein
MILIQPSSEMGQLGSFTAMPGLGATLREKPFVSSVRGPHSESEKCKSSEKEVIVTVKLSMF